MAHICYLFPPSCSCSAYLGRRQVEFEDLTSQGVSMVDAATKLGFRKMCCLNQILNCPMYFIISADLGRIVDRTGLINGTGSQEDYVINTPDIVLKRQPSSFPSLPGSSEFKETTIKTQSPIQKMPPIPSMVNFLSSIPVAETPVNIFMPPDSKE